MPSVSTISVRKELLNWIWSMMITMTMMSICPTLQVIPRAHTPPDSCPSAEHARSARRVCRHPLCCHPSRARCLHPLLRLHSRARATFIRSGSFIRARARPPRAPAPSFACVRGLHSLRRLHLHVRRCLHSLLCFHSRARVASTRSGAFICALAHSDLQCESMKDVAVPTRDSSVWQCLLSIILCVLCLDLHCLSLPCVEH